jgi:uncharacterized membrane protein YdjX (TVP38/TMEM64 family)
MFVLAAICLFLWFVGGQLLVLLEHAAMARTFVDTFGPLAPLIYILFFALQILIAPLPGQFIGVMSGYLFGVFWGSLYSIVGLALGAGIATSLGRRFGQPFLMRFFDKEQIRLWERKLRIRSAVTWGLLFLFPVPDIVFYVAGLSRVPLRQLVIAVIMGRSVGLIFANVVGNLSASLPPEWVLAKWVVLLLAALVALRYQRALRLFILTAVRRVQQWTRPWREKLFAANQG